MDVLLKTFFEKQRWVTAIDTGVDKNINKSLLREMSSPEKRLSLYNMIKNNDYVIAPPHEARIPKDDGTFRTVYVNDGADRIILSIVNDMLFELCPELIHPSCKSYQKHIGCGKIVKEVSSVIQNIKHQTLGVKVDLSKYFDSVPIEYIDNVFDYIECKFGKSNLIDIVRLYYHTNTVIDYDKNIIEKYSSLRQGCAVAAFLADAVLFDIDEKITNNYDVYYVRYSDDILILGNEWEKAYNCLQKELSNKQLILNPKKVEMLDKNKWFKFLGFALKSDKISLSKSRIKTFQKEIEDRTISHKNTKDISSIINSVNDYLYKGNGDYSWATSVLSVINVEKDINQLNGFVMDAIRAANTGKSSIGGLGVNLSCPDNIIVRGKGRNVKSNKDAIPILPKYTTLQCMRNALLMSKSVYTTLILSM